MVIDLVGHTGFVGSNLAISNSFSHCYNRQNILQAYGTSPDILVYAGVTGTKYVANKFPEKDWMVIKSAIENINKISAHKLVLISTIDVFMNPNGENENDHPTSSQCFTYGYHRSLLEEWVKENIKDYCIVRLPGIYGENIKKNYIYDLMNPIPQVLSLKKFQELYEREKDLVNYYILNEDGFYHLIELKYDTRAHLLELLKKLDFSSLNFTDTRGLFQYYNLKYLWKHINIALEKGINVLNITTGPFLISELYNYLYQKTFVNEMDSPIPYYNLKSKYSGLFGGSDGYIFSKEDVMADIKAFIKKYEDTKYCFPRI